MLLGRKGMQPGAPMFVRIFKEESELEVWKARDDGRFYHYKTYPICNWSGDLGPKIQQGDKQAPEGFYTIAKHQLNRTLRSTSHSISVTRTITTNRSTAPAISSWCTASAARQAAMR